MPADSLLEIEMGPARKYQANKERKRRQGLRGVTGADCHFVAMQRIACSIESFPDRQGATEALGRPAGARRVDVHHGGADEERGVASAACFAAGHVLKTAVHALHGMLTFAVSRQRGE